MFVVIRLNTDIYNAIYKFSKLNMKTKSEILNFRNFIYLCNKFLNVVFFARNVRLTYETSQSKIDIKN